MKSVNIFWIAFCFMFGCFDAPALASTVDHNAYATLLIRHVKDGRVDYKGLQKDEALLDQFLESLAAVDPGSLPAGEKIAFYINAYNAWTLKLILTRYPEINSIKELGGIFSSPWKKKIARINDEVLTLDHIENEILRKEYRDPRVHFAINCASMSCPPLQNEPFTGDRLDDQLNQATIAFINDSSSNRLENETLWLSKIFDWFSEDFNEDALSFVIRFAEEPLKSELIKNQKTIRIRFNPYDWSLNKTQGGNNG